MPPIPARRSGSPLGEEIRLAPVAFVPDVAAALVDPVAFDPDRMRTGRGHIGSWNPDIAVTVPAMIAGVPGPIGVSTRRGGYSLDHSSWWTDAYDDLGVG